MDWAKGPTQEFKVEPDQAVQGSQAWHAWRGKGLGSSDAAVLLGLSPWRTIQQLLDEKCGRWKPEFGPQQQSAMDRGKRLESVIRGWYERSYQLTFKEGVAEHPVRAYMRASFDGINREADNMDGTRGRIIEIKAPNFKDHALAAQGFVPDKYLPQCNWLMLVGAIDTLDYVSYGSDDTYHIVRLKADKRMQAELAGRAEVFWSYVERNDSSVEWFDNYSFTDGGAQAAVEDQISDAFIAKVLKAKEESSRATAEYEALKERLKKMLGDRQEMRCYDAEFGYTDRKGAIDYKAVPQLKGVDLEPYRKEAVKVFYFDRIAEPKALG